jgi:hypothetical protein
LDADLMLHRISGFLINLKTRTFFLILFVYLILVTIQGLDFNDEGFHAAVYQQILNDPNAVQYGFWMWLTGIFGGLFMKLFPFLGLWGIRLEGAIVSLSTIAIIYNLLEKYLHKGYLRLSIIMLVLFINEDAKNFYYNNFSAFCYFLAAYFIFKGLRGNKNLFIFISGIIISLNIFNRTPNILGVGILISIPFYGFLIKTSFRTQIKKIIIFIGGVFLGLVLVFGSMKLLGHLEIFINSMKMVFGLSQEAKSSDGLEGAYQISKLLTINFIEYVGSVRSVILVMVTIIITGIINHLVFTTSGLMKNIFRLLNYLILLMFIAAIFEGWVNHYRLVLLFTGLSLISSLLIFNQKADPLLRLLALLGCFILLIHPFGSSEGIATVIVYSMWLSFPISIDQIARIQKFDMNLALSNIRDKFSFGIKLYAHQLRIARVISFSLIILACTYNVIVYPYLCDRHNRKNMFYSVNNVHMKWILTTKARADALDNLLKASSQYIKPGDVVFAFDCMPMYHYMTETKSYVRNPCIWFYTSNLFKSELNYAETHDSTLPVVIRQKIKLTGDGSSWPEILPAENYFQFKRNLKKNAYFNEFLDRNNYREVWSSPYFEILIPQKKLL